MAGTNVFWAVRTGEGLGNHPNQGQGSSLGRKLEVHITTENRLRLYYKVAIICILKNMYHCDILPQTEIVCHIIEHCEPGSLLWGPSDVVALSVGDLTRGLPS